MKHEPVNYTLPNGKTIVLEYLYSSELDYLLRIPTSVEFANQILLRNMNLLENAVKKRNYIGYVGCPHCLDCITINCLNCAWYVPSKVQCLKVPFSEVVMKYINAILSYHCDRETLSYYKYVINEVDLDAEKNMNELVICYLNAHIEWAKAVILMDGIPWPEGMER